jgi:hypothetical protein
MPHEGDKDSNELVARLQANDGAAWALFVKRTRNPCYKSSDGLCRVGSVRKWATTTSCRRSSATCL